MKVRVGHEFLAQVARYELRFTCGDCAHHVRAKDACAHGWPDAEHRAPIQLVGKVAPEARAEVSFCKEFELA
jgi:hypothetical protein